MIAYVQQIAGEIAKRLSWWQQAEYLTSIEDRIATLAEELDRLDPRDFLPASQFEFVERRREVRRLSLTQQKEWDSQLALYLARQESILQLSRTLSSLENDQSTGAEQRREAIQNDRQFIYQENYKTQLQFEASKKLCEQTVSVLEKYGGLGSQAVTRSFAFVQDSDLRTIVDRDYKELSLILLPGHAWKSTVVLAGSILEAILFDLLTHDAERIADAMASKNAPRKKGGTVKNINSDMGEDEWKLSDLIKVAEELSLIPRDAAGNFHQSLREYRNFVHPRKEIKEDKALSEAEAALAKGALDLICNHLK